MEIYHVILIAVAAAIVLIYFIMPTLIYKTAFGSRYDKNPKLKYFTAQDFKLVEQTVETEYNGVALRGAIYSKKPSVFCKNLVIFQHGMGPGHAAYMTEIAALANAGHAVLALDSFGCNLSEGKKLKGFYAATECVIAAYNFAKNNKFLKDKPVYLMGHSWGGYAVCCATTQIKVEGVIAISAPVSPTRALAGVAKASFFNPVFRVLNRAHCGRNGNANAVKALQKSQVNALLIHGEKDLVVKLFSSVAHVAKGKNVTKFIDKEKYHNPYNTVEAEKLLHELNVALMDNYEQSYFNNFDFKAATEQDSVVMQQIKQFLKK